MSGRDDNARLLDHEYDGIRERDNPPPGWTLVVFAATIVFSLGYWIWYHAGGPGKSEAQAYTADEAAWKVVRAEAAKREVVSEAVLARAVDDAAVLERGKTLFATSCLSCHGPQGAGLVGPNLTDDRQIHGSSRLDIYQTIRDGVPAKGMLAWGTMMPQPDVVALTAFVVTLRGKPVAGKAGEGAPVGAFPTP
jgi:cytochrome c oxidase cbb3-type subunit 3